MISAGALLGGLALLCVTLGSVLGATQLSIRRWGGELDRPMRFLAYAVIATALLLVVHIVPGALGIVSRWTVPIASVLVLALAWRLTGAPAGGTRSPASDGHASRRAAARLDASSVIAFAAVGLVAAYALAYLRTQFGIPPLGRDAMTFHLPDVASWIHTGSMWQIDQFVPQLANGNYPNNGDVLYLAALLPFKSVVLVRAALLVYLPLTAVGVYAIARQLGSPRSSSVLFGAAACAIPAIVRPAVFDTQTDTLMLFGFAAGIAFLLHDRRSAGRTSFVVAGLALGISFGTKWYAVPCVLCLLALWAVGSAGGGERLLAVGRRGLVLLGLVIALGGFWLLRNLVESGDPLFPVRISPLGVTLFSAPYDVIRHEAGFTIGDYLLKPHILRTYIFPALQSTVTSLGALITLAGLSAAGAAAWACRRRTARARDGLVLLVAGAAVLMALVYIVTPYTAFGPRNLPVQTADNTRYLMPAVIAAAPLGAWLCGRLGRWRVLLEAATLALIVKSLSKLYFLRSVSALALAAVITIGLVLWQTPAVREKRHTRPRVPEVAAWGLAALVVVVLAFWARPRSDFDVYARSDPALDWLLTHAPSGHDVGLANLWSNGGLSPVLPAFGPRLGNRVSYVGPFVDHMLQQYPTEKAFQAALRRGRYDVLVIGLGYANPQPTVPDETWAEAAGYRLLVRSPRLALLVGPTVSAA